jgi:hypothetical protein
LSAPAPVEAIRQGLRLRRVARLTFAGGLAGIVVLLLLSWAHRDFYAVHRHVWWVLFAGSWGAEVVAELTLRLMPCPRCGEPFAGTMRARTYNPFARRCASCGLRSDGSNAAPD